MSPIIISLYLSLSILPVLLDPVESVFPGQQPALKLGFFYRIQDLFELRSGLQSQSDEVMAAEQPRRRNLGGAKFSELTAAKLIRAQVAAGGERIEPRQLQQFLHTVLP